MRKALDPVAALAVGGADVPRAGSGIAAVAKRDAGRDGDPVRLALLRQLQACGSGFKLSWSGCDAAWVWSFCVPDVSRRWVWRRMDAYIAHMEGLQKAQWLRGMPMEAYVSRWRANSPSEGLLGRSCRRVETARQSPTATGTAKPPPRRMVQKRMRRRLRPAPLFHQRNSGKWRHEPPPGPFFAARTVVRRGLQISPLLATDLIFAAAILTCVTASW